MKISIITVCLNSAETIRDTIECILCQNYPNVEYIICDGGSIDDTLSIIDSVNANIKVLPGPDDGIYDAMNKGISAATGEVIGILNSDDLYANENVLGNVMEAFLNPTVNLLYGDLHYVHRNQVNKVYRVWKSGKLKPIKFKFGWSIPHPTFFVRKSIYERYGLYNPSFKLAGDYELILRYLYKHRLNAYYLPEVLVNMKTMGVGGSSMSNRLLAHQEDRIAWEVNDLRPSFWTIPMKPLRKIPQLFIPHLRDHSKFLRKRERA